MNLLYLYLCYFTFGWCLSYTGIAIQFTMIDHLQFTPVEMTMSIGVISAPWCVKPLYGFISDKYAVFDWGRRRPYIAMSGLLASFLYVHMRLFIHSKDLFIMCLALVSGQLCIADVCADSITVELVKKEKTKGDIQTKCWTCRAFGTLIGALLSGVSYNSYGALGVFHICSFCPLVMSILIWNLPKHDVPDMHKDVFSKLIANIKEQRSLALVFLFLNMAPDYSELYVYFLRSELDFTPTDFSWLSISSSLSFLLATIMYNRFLLKVDPASIILIGIVGGTIFRLTQLLVITKTLPYFSLVLFDGVAESFFGQMVLMPLIVKAAGAANDGVEGSLYALMMSISNFSSVLGDWLGGLVGMLFNVTENCYDNFIWVMVLGIACNFIVPCVVIQKMPFVSVSDPEK